MQLFPETQSKLVKCNGESDIPRLSIPGVAENVPLLPAVAATFHGRRLIQPHSHKTFELMGLDSSPRNSVVNWNSWKTDELLEMNRDPRIVSTTN